ncbi:hypothetical protein AB0935_26310 [Streptomyces sp. NPDC007027]|uniref:hypothetical protein n=1 Tax=unclassified Streptomyces TaxID=2593676 RepID=UPI00345708AD
MRHGKKAATNPLQTDHQVKHKADRCAAGWAANLAHTGTHAATTALALVVGAAAILLRYLPGLADQYRRTA